MRTKTIDIDYQGIQTTLVVEYEDCRLSAGIHIACMYEPGEHDSIGYWMGELDDDEELYECVRAEVLQAAPEEAFPA